jgi:hypothetical protein
MLGKAAVAMWWNMAPEHRDEFQDWHTHEHFPERMGIPGFLRGSRWANVDGGEGFFVIYELDEYATLTSEAYRERLNHPTPWSVQMMPRHRYMVRSQCRVLETHGGGIGRFALTLRVSPVSGREAELRAWLSQLAGGFVRRAGGVACHLLRTETPDVAATTEQQIRGGKDAAADWIVLAVAYGSRVLREVQSNELDPLMLRGNGARDGSICDVYELSCTATPGDFSNGS